MKRPIITLLCAVGMVFSVPASAAPDIRPDAPQRYVVKQGDTLWSIAGKYLYQPWQWSSLWGRNRHEIDNPHRIYPGQVLVLRYTGGQPGLDFEHGSRNADGIPVIKLSPRMRETSGYGIPAVNVQFYRLFMQHPQIISPQETADAPRLIAGPDNRLLYTTGQRVYAYGITEPGRYLTYRINKNITDPDTRKVLGQEAVFSGIVRTLPYTDTALANRSRRAEEKLEDNEYYSRKNALIHLRTQSAQPMMVETAVSEIRQNDYLMKLPEGDSFHMIPHAPNHPVRAKVVSVFDGVGEAGQFQTITLNQGAAHGLDKGMVLSLYKRNRLIRINPENNLLPAPKSRDIAEAVSIPAEEIGLAMIYRTSENLSSAIILESLTGINIGDTAAEPGRDLDNMADFQPSENETVRLPNH
ncbi:LysM peptidoglycan-binding domain-containing protein [Neisseria animalis]|uniref:LysM domain-containing protein n=1 Tax=Neisseria animalis TaxID=492 RepID=A0A5P3MS45_NEIAN|nr:LysM domain-containing protein [Neisseria animalis]QEY23925.1 LysM domain-containing protein [Neisseria animalis]ROW31483.1 LysM domain-containing protein [Neisseria animalis]VEE05880.1 periplasmic protein (possibly peptidoglycan-binding) [Neisseria animalis]